MEWWNSLSTKQKLTYSFLLSLSSGASIGGLTARNTFAGLGLGALAGFGVWGLSVTLYSAYKTQQAASAIQEKADALPF